MENQQNIQVEELAGILEDYAQDNYAEKLALFLNTTEHFSETQLEQLWDCIMQSENVYMKVVILWECLYKHKTSKHFTEYVGLIYEADCLSWSQRYFLQWQMISLNFNHAGLGEYTVSELLFKNYEKIYQEYERELTGLEYMTQRNENLVFVTVQQFLNMQHGPTKTTLDRARVIKQQLHKDVIIINTAELFGGTPVEIVHGMIGSYDPSLVELENITYEGETFPYIQFDNNMPNQANSQEFIHFVRQYAPYCIINIGSESLLTDACSKIVPVLDVNTVPSGIARTKATMQVVGKKVTKQDNDLLQYIGKSIADVIEGRFTSSLKPQKCHFTREQLGIPSDTFALAVVGVRLTDEADDTFIRMLQPVLQAGGYLVIIGKMDTYERMCKEYDWLRNHSVNLGLQEDVLAALEVCDLYVNPKRTGGGTSVIEAMHQGLPAVSLPMGDVALGAGEAFCVSTYDEMAKQIVRYMQDAEFYRRQSEAARNRAAYMLDSNTAFIEILNAFFMRCRQLDRKDDTEYYLRAIKEQELSQNIDSYFDLQLAKLRCTNDEEQKMVQDALQKVSDIQQYDAYTASNICQTRVEECMRREEYELAQKYLELFLFSQDKTTFQLASSEENMGLYLLIEIILSEQNNTQPLQYSMSAKAGFGQDVRVFYEVYTPLKHMIRRVWYGFDMQQQQELAAYVVKHRLSGDFIAIAVKYSTPQRYWQDILKKVIILFDAYAKTDAAITEPMERLFLYYQWFVKNGIGAGGQVEAPFYRDNGAVSIHLEYTPEVQTAQQSVDENRIDFIYCTNDAWYSQECERYIRRLQLDPQMQIRIYSVWNSPSMAAGYNCAMNMSTAKYKIYIHHDTFIIHTDMITDLLQGFGQNSEYGALGIAGTTHLEDNAMWQLSDKEDMREYLYQDAIMDIKESRSIVTNGFVEEADALDGILIATSQDCKWREDLFTHWHFYDISQCYEFRRAGKKVGVINPDKMWLMHETTMRKDPNNTYEMFRDIFVKEYFNGGNERLGD